MSSHFRVTSCQQRKIQHDHTGQWVGVGHARGYAAARPMPLSSLTIEPTKPVLTVINEDKSVS